MEKIRHVDLFCGIGGFRLGTEQACNEHGLGYECVFSSDIAKVSREVYKDNFGEYPSGNITLIHEKDIPDHDILTGGFPCQAFSCAGMRAGFNDPKGRGTLIYHILRIAKEKRPRVMLLENVTGILYHDGGETFKEILRAIRETGYYVRVDVLNSLFYGVPQHRRRVFFVCFRYQHDLKRFQWPKPTVREFGKIEDILAPETVTWKDYCSKGVALRALSFYRDKSILCGGSFSGVLTVQGQSAGYFFDDSSVPVDELVNKGKGESYNLRTFTGREQAGLQGFPESFILPRSSSPRAHSFAFGNSVTVPVIKVITLNILAALMGDELERYDPAEQRSPFVSRPLDEETERRRKALAERLGLKDCSAKHTRAFEYPLLKMRFY